MVMMARLRSSIRRLGASLTVALGIATAGSVSWGPTATAAILITEINSNGTGGDFFELYNSGSTPIDLTGWRWSDYDLAVATGWAAGSSLDAVTLAAGEVAVVQAGSNVTSPTPLWGSAAAATAFRTSWGLAPSVPIFTWTGNGAGLGQGDGIVLYNASGNVATSTIYRVAPLSDAIQQDGSTVPLTTFVKSFPPQPTVNGHAGVMGGVGATPAGTSTESLVWDPSSPVGSPTYRNSLVGQWGGFANPNSAVTIGSPGVIVPEPSAVCLTAAAAGLALAALAHRRA
ncbi:MAG: lamin tail domain-containing protein [Planctomycetia bacterium]